MRDSTGRPYVLWLAATGQRVDNTSGGDKSMPPRHDIIMPKKHGRKKGTAPWTSRQEPRCSFA